MVGSVAHTGSYSGNHSGSHFKENRFFALLPQHPFFGWRLAGFGLFAFLALCSIAFRLWYLQWLHGGYYRDMSENNRTRRIRTVAPRGEIFDRDGKLLVGSRPAYDIGLILEDVPDLNTTIERLSRILGRDKSVLQSKLSDEKRTKRAFEPKLIAQDVSREELARLKVNSYQLPGMLVSVSPARYYPQDSLGAALFGYSREINKEQLDRLSGDGYLGGDLIGQAGIEKSWEKYLRGVNGYEVIEVDAMGVRRGGIGEIQATQGRALHLTIDLDLQHAAERALAGRKGAVAAVNPQTGEVLALVSSPLLNANIFSGVMDRNVWSSIIKDPNKPLKNRAITETYPPGSTFKLLSAVAGLSEGKINADTAFSCPGYYMFAGRPFQCHKKGGHGRTSLHDAIMLSCNVYFYHLGQMLGIEGLTKIGREFGFGEKTGINLPGESAGVLPSIEWKRRQFGERWWPGETISVAIGQGYWAVSPLQMAMAIAALTNGGILYEPNLVSKIVSRTNGEVIEYTPRIKHRLTVKQEALTAVKNLAVDVVNAQRGTGKRAKLPGILVGGKTGTAQVKALGKAGSQDTNDHAWFVAFAPQENPSIAMAVVVENAGKGGQFAAPVAREVLAVHFRKLGFEIPDVEDPSKAVVDGKVSSEAVLQVHDQGMGPDTGHQDTELTSDQFQDPEESAITAEHDLGFRDEDTEGEEGTLESSGESGLGDSHGQ